MYPVEQPAIGFSTHRFAFSPEPDSGFLQFPFAPGKASKNRL
jgi:hypothetical protein